MFACLQVRSIETEVAKPPNLKRAVQGNSANVVFFFSHCRHESLSGYDTLTRSMSPLQLIWPSPVSWELNQPSAGCRYHSLDRRGKNGVVF
jgi:hypothetical protein